MTTLKKIKELKDKESRQFFYEEHIETGLPIQLRELRKKRKLTQKELAELTGFDQSNISDWENPNYEYTPQIGTLQRFANAFDVPLIVRFGSWEELLEWDNNLSPEKVAPDSFDGFVEKFQEENKNQIEFEISDKLSVNNPVIASTQSDYQVFFNRLPSEDKVVGLKQWKESKASTAQNLISENSEDIAA